MNETPVDFLTRAVDIVGGQSALAAALSKPDKPISSARVWNWINRDGGAPADYCPLIERATNGQVRCEDLRPDVAWDVLRHKPARASRVVVKAA